MMSSMALKDLFMLMCIVIGGYGLQMANGLYSDQEAYPIGATFPSRVYAPMSSNRVADKPSSIESPQYDSMQKVLINELDANDKSTMRPINSESWRRQKVEQLLEELSDSMSASLQNNERAYHEPILSSSVLSPEAVQAHFGAATPDNENLRILAVRTNPAKEAPNGATLADMSNPVRWDHQSQYQDQHDQQQQQEHQNPASADFSNSRATGPAKIRKSDRLAGAMWSAPNRRFAAPSGAAGKLTPYYSELSSVPVQSARLKPAYVSASGPVGAGAPTPVNSNTGPAILGHRIGSEEVALSAPPPINKQVSGQFAEYETKRTEAPRWNNLRGMWGKRSINDKNGRLLDDIFKQRQWPLADTAFKGRQVE